MPPYLTEAHVEDLLAMSNAIRAVEDAPRALGYLRREAVREGSRVQIARGEARLNATVTLP